MKQRMECNRGGGADGEPPLKSRSCVCALLSLYSHVTMGLGTRSGKG